MIRTPTVDVQTSKKRNFQGRARENPAEKVQQQRKRIRDDGFTARSSILPLSGFHVVCVDDGDGHDFASRRPRLHQHHQHHTIV